MLPGPQPEASRAALVKGPTRVKGKHKSAIPRQYKCGEKNILKEQLRLKGMLVS